ncbi:hypothetical protein Q9K86_005029 [Escherichia coli]|uniref:hypothetical protein n=1 Tax=Escherichia coli TaxID=562 RepID=UPI0012FF8221|nr:hypothetical protein [Escherichia coli]ELH6406499.1 hypothetical protein [Escherichia coli]MBS8646702.1 hypothetical protein [Escherichia coli]
MLSGIATTNYPGAGNGVGQEVLKVVCGAGMSARGLITHLPGPVTINRWFAV